MRPVNLIPPEERRGDRAPLRRGPVAYALVGALAVALVAVLALVLFSNSVTEKESRLAALEAERDAVAAEAQALAPYAQFAAMQQNRELTVISLADSRFDWERVLRELALVIPDDVWLLELTGEAVGNGEDGGTLGPSLQISGCGRDHEAVARFIAALEDIDGVTRVGLSDTVREEGGSSGSNAEGGATCYGRDLPATFNAQAVFDNVAAAPPASAPAPEAAEPQTEPGSTPATASTQAGGKGKKDANVVAGVAKP
ncbi:MAG TPA: PilN domain-containing protein [Solirubrobacterales bacterium]|jgi:Tfp pilus assembly protein PilN